MVKSPNTTKVSQVSHEPGSTIRAVELECGISAMTLRDWERRFGFPAPERRQGSDRRVYSTADVERLKLLKNAMARGYRIGDVIAKDNLELEAIGRAPEAVRDSVSLHIDFDGLVLLLAHDRFEELERHIRAAAAAREPTSFVVDYAEPLMVAVGRAWEDGRISIRHEHLASDMLTTALRELYGKLQAHGTHPVILLATLPGEVYSLPILFVAVYLAALGAKTRVLGGGTPVEELVAAARAMRVDVVGISVSCGGDKRTTKRALQRLREGLPSTAALWVGGAGARSLGLDDDLAETLMDWQSITVAAMRQRRRVAGLVNRRRLAQE